MRVYKQLLSCLLAMALLLISSAAALGEELIVPEEAPIDADIGLQEGTELVIGATSELSGYFFSNLWGINTSDMDVRMLLHGYGTIAWTRELNYLLDPTVVLEAEATYDLQGNKTYTFTLQENMTYSDGTPITAADYVFSILLKSAPQVRELDGMIMNYAQYTGHAAFADGESPVFSGVRLLDEYVFSVEISADYLEYFYELSYVDIQPAPIHVIAPGCEIADDGEGAYIRGEFTAALLRETLLDPETGYVFAPMVSSGPYTLESYDPETHEAVFVVNPEYLGNYEGQMPHIERVRLVPVTNAGMVEAISQGDVQLLHKVANATTIDNLLVMSRDGYTRSSNYLRSGFAFLSFACEEGPTQFANVRKAIALCLDKQLLTTTFAGAYGLRTYGYYGLGQWMTTFTADADAEHPEPLDVLAEVSAMEAYTIDLNRARNLLIEDGWVYDENGEPYVEGGGGIRYKEVEGELMPLMVNWAKTIENPTADALAALLNASFVQIGIGLTIEEMPFTEMLTYYYRQQPRTYNMFFLATNFTHVFDPYNTYNTGDAYQGSQNTTGLRDEALMELAIDLRQTEPGDERGYCEKWLVFQEKWVDLLPAIPLYSNVYFDFFIPELLNYHIDGFSSWALAVPYAFYGTPEEIELGEEELIEIGGDMELIEIEIEDDAELVGNP